MPLVGLGSHVTSKQASVSPCPNSQYLLVEASYLIQTRNWAPSGKLLAAKFDEWLADVTKFMHLEGP